MKEFCNKLPSGSSNRTSFAKSFSEAQRTRENTTVVSRDVGALTPQNQTTIEKTCSSKQPTGGKHGHERGLLKHLFLLSSVRLRAIIGGKPQPKKNQNKKEVRTSTTTSPPYRKDGKGPKSKKKKSETGGKSSI